MRSLLPWVHRGLLAGLLLIVYVFAWSPARTQIMAHVAGPVLHHAGSPKSDASVQVNRGAGTVRIQLPGDRGGGTLAAPAGVQFLLPALVLVFLAPHRPYWLPFWAGHVALSGLMLLGWVVALLGIGGGVYVAQFTKAYLLDAYSLGVPTFVWAHRFSVFPKSETSGLRPDGG